MIQIAAPIISEEEIAAVQAVLRSGMLAQGPKVEALEEAFAAYCGTRYAVVVNSGTAALHSALFAAGIGPGDEVITTPYSFIATINPILMVGARPVLVDIDPQTYNIDVKKIEAVITPKTKAILPVHLYGQPVDYTDIKALAKTHKLIVIEDACQAVGSEYKGIKAGNLGDMGCFSLYATKNIMSGEGGIVSTNNTEFAQIIKRFRQHGMSGPYEYAHIGYNYRMTDLLAAIAFEQLKHVDSFNQKRQHNAALLTQGLQNVRGIVVPVVSADRTHVYHQYTIRVTKDFRLGREELMAALKSREIGSGIYYPKPLHAYAHIQNLGYALGDFPIAEETAREVLSLPVHPTVTEADVSTIVAAFKDIANG